MFEPIGETKVRDDHVPVSIEEEVFEFEVAVDDLFLMNIPDTRDELTEKFARVLLLQVTVGEDVVEEFTTRRVLEDDADILVRLDDVVKSDNIRVFEGLWKEVGAKPPAALQWDRTDDEGDSDAPLGLRFHVRPWTSEQKCRYFLFGSASRRPLLPIACEDRV